MMWAMRLRAVMVKEVRQLRRDRLSMGMILGMPIIQLLLFGYAINTDLRNLSTVVVDQARTNLSRELVSRLEASQVLDVVLSSDSVAEAEGLIRSGRVLVAVVIPPDYERRVLDPTRTAAQLVVDGSDPTVAGAVAGLLSMQVLQPIEPAPAGLFELYDPVNPAKRSAVFIVPGLVGVILTMTMLMFTAVAVVRERERGNLEFLITTPVRSWELMVGKIMPYVFIGLFQVALILSLGALLFDIPFRGGLLDLFAAALLFIIANLGLGLMISTMVRSQFQAMQGSFFVLLPSILLSGFMFPFAGMPQFAQHLAQLLPLTHFVVVIRGIVLKGGELSEFGPQLWALGGFALIALTFASLRFSKSLD